METWVKIVGYNYMISDQGNVISNNYNKSNLNKKLKKIKQKTGYYHVTLFDNGKRLQISIHRLVAQAYIPNPENKPHVNHKDGNKQNNNVDNLEWCTASENRKHAFCIGIQKPSKSNLGNKYGESFRKRSCIVVHEDGSEEFFSNIREASHKFKISETSISNCLNKRSNSAGGKKWKYA